MILYRPVGTAELELITSGWYNTVNEFKKTND